MRIKISEYFEKFSSILDNHNKVNKIFSTYPVLGKFTYDDIDAKATKKDHKKFLINIEINKEFKYRLVTWESQSEKEKYSETD